MNTSLMKLKNNISYVINEYQRVPFSDNRELSSILENA